MSYSVSLISPEEAEQFIRSIKSPDNKNSRRTIVLSPGIELKGSFSLTARNHQSNEVEWELHQDNLLTDYGRRMWMEGKFSTIRLGFCPSIEVPNVGRYSISTDAVANSTFASASLSPVIAPSTFTKTVSTTFGVPTSNRTLGMIGIVRSVPDTSIGLIEVGAFAILTPPKTQTTTQTLEVVYRISMNPIS